MSWAGLCPSARQSGPRTRAGKKGQGDTWLRGSLGQAAIGAARTATFLGERYARIARRRGKAKAQVAVARVQYFGDRGIDLGLLCLLIWALVGLALLGAAVFRDALRTWPSRP